MTKWVAAARYTDGTEIAELFPVEEFTDEEIEFRRNELEEWLENYCDCDFEEFYVAIEEMEW